jgi:hypothetical protein
MKNIANPLPSFSLPFLSIIINSSGKGSEAMNKKNTSKSVVELIYFVSESKRFATLMIKVKRRNSKSKRNH